MTQNITIHTDGSCQGNPGPGGWAAIIEIPDWMNATLRGGDPQTTNNRMELTAAIEGLRKLERIIGASEEPVVLRSDSKYLCDAFNQGWIENWHRNGWRTAKKEPVKNRDLWVELEALTRGKQITWSWVKGHNGDHFNELCDRIANEEAEAARMSREGRPEPDPEAGTPKNTQPDPEAGTPKNTQPDPEADPDGSLAMRILADVFTAAAKAEDFEDFRERLGEFEKTIQWSELIHGRPPAGSQGPREALYEHPVDVDDLSF